MELVTIEEAAARRGMTPWQVVQLIEAGEIRQVVYVDGSSLADHAKEPV